MKMRIIKALYDDFKKPALRPFYNGNQLCYFRLKDTIRIYTNGQKPKGFPSLLNFPSKDYIYKDPYGKY
jgi:aldehyde dehydrogenase (NAD+)